MGKDCIQLEGLSPERAFYKLKRAGIKVIFARKKAINRIDFCVLHKDIEKVFAIFSDSCYTIKKVYPFGIRKIYVFLIRRIGLIAGILLFAMLTFFSNTFVLKINVVGSGSYYRDCAISVLKEYGVAVGKQYSNKNNPLIYARLLRLDNVSFASVSKQGTIVTVEIQTSEEDKKTVPGEDLISPYEGVVYDIVLVRGTTKVLCGQMVKQGDVLISGEGNITVIGAVILEKSYKGTIEAQTEEEALKKTIFSLGAEENQILLKKVEKKEEGYAVELSYLVTLRKNMD